MAYKVFSKCVENGKVVQKAPSSTLTVVPTSERPKWFTIVIKAKQKFLTFEEKVFLFSQVPNLNTTWLLWGVIFPSALSTTGVEGMAVWNPVAATFLCRVQHLESCLLKQKALLMAYHSLSIMYKEKILK